MNNEELVKAWEYYGDETKETFEEFSVNYTNFRQQDEQYRQARLQEVKDNNERHNWLYSVNG